jgi:hypothetical protein
MGIQCFRAILGDSVKQAGCGELRDSAKHQRECDERSGGTGNHSLPAQSIPILPLPFVPLNLSQPRAEAKLRGQKERCLIHANRTGRCRIQPAAQPNIHGTPFTGVFVTLPMEPYPAVDSEFVLNELRGDKGKFSVAKPRTLSSLVTTSLVTNSNTSSLPHLVWRDREFLEPHPILHFLLPKYLDMYGNSDGWLPSPNTRTKRPRTDNNQSNVFLKNYGTKMSSTLVLSIQDQSYITVTFSLHVADPAVENRLGELSVEQKLIAESTSSGSMNPLRNVLLPFHVFFE